MSGRGHGALPVVDEADALREVELVTRGAMLVGAVPSFDAETLAARMRANGLCPSWHHRLRCVESMVMGRYRVEANGLAHAAELVGYDFPAADRHTALGDARACRAVFDAVMADESAVAS